MDVRHAAVQRILDGDEGAGGAAVIHRVEGILEAEAGERQAVRETPLHRDMGVRARRALKGDGALGIGGGGGHKLGDQRPAG